MFMRIISQRTVLASLIVELSRMYFENVKDEPAASPKARIIRDNIQKDIYQCIHCQTVYDSEVGDIDAGIGPKTLISGFTRRLRLSYLRREKGRL